MNNSHKVVFALVAFAAISLSSAMSARADIVVFPGNIPQIDENVLLGTGIAGNPIFGETNQTHFSVRFSGDETLTAPANGQARVEALDRSLNALRIDLSDSATGDPTGSFRSLILNLNAEAAGTVFFTAVDTMGDIFLSSSALGAGGENFFTFMAINGQRISYVSFTTTVPVGLGLDDVRQVRIGGAQQNTNPVPEPASMLLLGTGLAGLASGIRRRRTEAGFDRSPFLGTSFQSTKGGSVPNTTLPLLLRFNHSRAMLIPKQQNAVHTRHETTH